MLTCERARRLIVLADDLTGDEGRRLEEHLRVCPPCRGEWERWQRFWSILSSLPPASPDPGALKRLYARLAEVSTVAERDCLTTRQMIWLWLDDALPEGDQMPLFVHLAHCDECQKWFWQAERYKRLMHTLPRAQPSPERKAALLRRVRIHLRLHRICVWTFRFASATAACFLLMIGLWRLVHRSSPSQTPSLVQVRPIAPEAKLKPPPSYHRPPPVTRGQQESLHLPLPSLTVQRRIVKHKTRAPKPYAFPRTQKVTPQTTNLPLPRRRLIAPPLPPSPQPSLSALKPSLTPSRGPFSPVIIALKPKKRGPHEPMTFSQRPQPLPLKRPAPRHDLPSRPSDPPERPKLIALPPLTFELDKEPLTPSRPRLTHVPSSQRLYRRFGVAFRSVPPEKDPPQVGEPFPTEASLPWMAERYRSRTAVIRLFQLGVSW